MERYKTLIIVFLVGFILGQWSSGGCRRQAAPSYEAPPGRESAADSPSRPVSAKGEVVLGDFESDRELDGEWKTYRVKAERVAEHATHGRYSAKLTYLPSDGASAFMIEGALRSHGASDWRQFEKLKFDLYNPGSSQVRVILQIKDSGGERYKEDIYLQPESQETISITLADLEGYVKLARVEQFNLFQWKPTSRSELYLDNVRLVPPGAESQAKSQEAAPLRLAAADESVSDSSLRARDSWQVAWETSLTKVFREPEKFTGEVKNPVQFSLARHEFESAQVVLVGGRQPAQIQATASELIHTNGVDRIKRDAIDLRRVAYVETRRPYYPVQHVGAWPDALAEANEFQVKPGAAQPIWLTVYAAHGTVPGTYRGTLTLTDSSGRKEEVALEVTVWDFELPITPSLKTAFDFYPGRLQRAYREFVPGGSSWEGKWHQLQRRYFLAMLRNRIWPIWNVNPNDPSFAWDVESYLEQGLGLIGIGGRGGSAGNNWPTDHQALERIADEYFQYARTLRGQQLLDRAYVYTYDEPKPGHPHVAQVMAAIHAASPDLKNLLVMHEAPNPALHAAWLKDADILCIRNAAFSPEMADRYRQLGKEIWMYVSSPSHPFPALVIDHPAIAARILPWMCWKYGATGLLYWCVNFWEGDPMANPASFAKDQNGNGYLFYPGPEGPVPSIRLELLRDGMEDYEYLYRLRELVEQAPEGTDPALLERAETLAQVSDDLVESLRSYSKDPAVLLSERRAIAETIVALQQHVTGDL